MADDSDQEKTEEPTSKRLEDAQKQGQVARSRELNTFAMLLASTLMFLLWGKAMGLALIKLMQREFQLSRETIFDVASVLAHFKQVMFDGFMIVAPLLAVLVVTAILAPLALGGWVFSWEAIAPKFDKMDPFKGLARLFAVHGLIELGKALLKFLLIASVSWVLYSRYIGELSGLNAEPLEPALTHGLMIIVDCLLILTASLIVVVAVDVPFQLWEHSKKVEK
ncbi:EscU/YscU/HrcU family type III secretion system export apparatus switch protein [Methylocucumis oryzae]|uniref:EscU/YscU/HrcU family type III secretion system export apparatus switch protein n=1 Tax=Methylocucumis oryzae TaxID=1632867 RepID=UPI000AAFB102